MSQNEKGLLERAGVHITEEDGELLKKSVDATKAVLDSIGTVSSTKVSVKNVGSSAPRMSEKI